MQWLIELYFSTKSTKSNNWDRWNRSESDIYLISKALCIALHFHHFRSTINLKIGQTNFSFLFHISCSSPICLFWCCCSKFAPIFIQIGWREKKRQFSLFTQCNVAPPILKSGNSILPTFFSLIHFIFLLLSLLCPLSMRIQCFVFHFISMGIYFPFCVLKMQSNAYQLRAHHIMMNG